MNFSNLINSHSMVYILPFLIFFSRVFDVSLGTIRIIFVNKGMKYIAPLIGFFEVLIWLIVINQVINKMNTPINYFAYAAGFAAGNFMGIYLEGKLAMGVILLRIITQKKAQELIQFFRADGYYVTNIPASSNTGEVEVIYLTLQRKDLPEALKMIKIFNPNAIYTITDMRLASKGAVPSWNHSSVFSFSTGKNLFRFGRKSK